ncbi:hypothetical protein PHYBLDRAFT_67052 [Phycomyces blakesleeanus NRRL 1555(-)]|uniref:Tc1-like transposase DDE domain-containing protein n=1 Tax=Phycomyces blakesleeanus (strain ATCC 8743b / DSM 1359 / FGSC 10004 / NBRC 33097 / NRRL 1555) TaxID=763407 RepID=A0A167KV10_PHYB8|nr:hypothetical protein PHYBLDRAFT_67052 [Phycomyces blakesleeanus NRRL 1555(-)]OAD68949.1 hypothetical protein PHYBLDRAFT_67052 [Phycomyces blakesleeanus NRRL 1555(-)]|eukprot:XP_018286989.1 hypothetical protein PHYBLDRAFT_67052 [Phycomyces blakesleeanus NRRL 1555(-)]
MYWKWSTEGYFLTPFNIFFIFLYSLYSVYKLYYKSYLNCEIGYLSRGGSDGDFGKYYKHLPKSPPEALLISHTLGHYSDPSIISWYLVPLLALKLSRDQWTLSVRISKTSTPKKIKAHSGRKLDERGVKGFRLVMDNRSIHNVTTLAEQRGYQWVHLPPYSPFLNSIEECWAKIKAGCRRKRLRIDKAITQRIFDSASLETHTDIKG